MKIKTQYSCQSCGYSSPKWLGRCPGCDGWSTFIEERTSAETPAQARAQAFEMTDFHAKGLPTGPGKSAKNWYPLEPTGKEGEETELRPQARISTGIGELNRVLGGGMVPDSFVLLGGDPGIGKSTLLLQMAKGLRSENPDLKILYVSGEESIDQIRGRSYRLGVQGEGRVFLAAKTLLEDVFATIKEVKPDVIVMDSLQTFSSGSLESAPGSVSQVREVALRLMNLAKSAGICIWLVGHVTKEGNIAGPKVIEHMVDTVLYFEAEAGQTYRLLRTVKNRFGSSRELGVFEMDGEGLREISNPSSLFLSERREPVPGTAVVTSLEGTRPILVELQALVATSALAMPRRTAVGFDTARISLLAAILEKHMHLSLAQRDLFFNVAGGLKLSEPACDLGAAAAIWSSLEEKPIASDWAFIGELGLTGEVRRVAQTDVRIAEAKKLGFKTLVIPKGTQKLGIEGAFADNTLRIIPVARVDDLPRIFKELR